jgi:hypothetical protein
MNPAMLVRALCMFPALAIGLVATGDPLPAGLAFARDDGRAAQRGVYELALEVAGELADPWAVEFTVSFTRPDGSIVRVDGFYDGGRTFRARAYCDAEGRWMWTSASNAQGLDGRKGMFEVVASKLPGKLRRHPQDPYQFAYDNGDWFLHIGDTGYRYLARSEPMWKQYIDQAAQKGATKIRAWYCESRGGVEALFAEGRRGMDVSYWQEMDRRVAYALQRHPRVMFQLIPYGEDTAELLRYGKDDPMARLVARYAQARLSAFPNVTWCISNDREIVPDGRPVKGRQVPAGIIDRIGRDMAAREPWGTLLTNHQARGTGYAFAGAPWSDIVTLEDIDQVHGKILLDYRARAKVPVINDEDRYELYKSPRDPRYFFRRLMWASLLSGGHATYGGLKTYEAFDGADRGVQGYFDAKKEGKLAGGADDFVHIHRFFSESGLTLVGLKPDDAAAGGDPLRWKCSRDERTVIIYLANPDGRKPESDRPAALAPAVSINLPERDFASRWFSPSTGRFSPEPSPTIGGGAVELRAPGGGDWVLLLQARQSGKTR